MTGMRLVCAALLLWLAGPARGQEAPRPAPPAVVAVPPEEPAQPRPLHKRPWLWITLAGTAAVLAAGIALGTIYGGPDRDPEPRFRGFGN